MINHTCNIFLSSSFDKLDIVLSKLKEQLGISLTYVERKIQIKHIRDRNACGIGSYLQHISVAIA
jgi:hypothetical protein